MKRSTEKTSLLASLLGMTGVLAVLCADLLNRRTANKGLAAPIESGNETTPAGDVSPDLLAAYEDRFIAALVLWALLSGILAVAISVQRIVRGDNGQFAAIGVVSGLLTVIWVGKFYIYGP